MRTAILVAALALAGCATQPQTPEQRAQQQELSMLLLRMAQPRAPAPSNTLNATCRTYNHGTYLRTVCD